MTWSANKNQNKFGGLATTKRANEQQNLNDARDGAIKHRRFGKLISESEAIALLKDILQVLAFVRQQQVIHGDIEPADLIRRG